MKKLIITLILTLSIISVFAQESKKSVVITRISQAPKIDGVLDDACWQNVEIAKDFVQLRPNNGSKATFRSEIKFVYDDKAIYIAAMLYDSAPDSIMKQYSPRDEIDVSDFLGIYIDPYNNGLNAYGFFVTPVNVQIDMQAQENGGEDENWNAVWKSATNITDEGWIVEYKIPYSALRFPKTDVQTWGLNVFRNIQRYRENSTWSFIDSEKQGWISQEGELTGIKNIDPPLRLSFSPYVSTYFENNSETSSWTNFYRGGLDLKYGINESFTLDMMLVPDFGQVQSDDVVLNLTPFEMRYSEKRQFFTEGTELFDKANIFYSRRIGASPNKYYDIELLENEEITENPSETQLINATKISGRTSKGLGIGFLNGMTLESNATIQDTLSGNKRNFVTQPFTNYNVLVFDQNLKNNSSISIINTNLSRFNDNYTANVTGSELSLYNKKKTYQIFAKGAVSQIFNDTLNPNYGYYSFINFSKSSGQFRFSLSNRIESDTYNPNDMGYLYNNNEITYSGSIRYNFYKPFWKLLSMYNNMHIFYSQLFNPNEYTNMQISFNSNMTFRNHFSTGFWLGLKPYERHDYFEARVDGRVFVQPRTHHAFVWFSTDYRKKLAFDINMGGSPKNEDGSYSYEIGLSPRIRLSDKFKFSFNTNYENEINDFGYVEYDDANEIIYFGKRDIVTIENQMDVSYIFNEKISSNINLRHYWSTVGYNDYYTLNQDGSLLANDIYAGTDNINFNYFTIDLSFRWIFAPGSEFSAVWKNSILTYGSEIDNEYFKNFENTLDSPQINSFSIKILYYLDYLSLRRRR